MTTTKPKFALDEKIKNGETSEADAQSALNRLEEQYRLKVAELRKPYDAAYAELWSTALSESDMGERVHRIKEPCKQCNAG